jgi:site-specific recombinase XerC
VRLELSAIRGLFQFMLDMNAPDVMFNPAKGVKVKTTNQSLEAKRVEQQVEHEKVGRIGRTLSQESPDNLDRR